MTISNRNHAPLARPRVSSRGVLRLAGFAGLAAMVAISAIVTKEAVVRAGGAGGTGGRLGSLAGVTSTPTTTNISLASVTSEDTTGAADVHDPLVERPAVKAPVFVSSEEVADIKYAPSSEIRYFNGRPVRPARTITMTVTAYSPDEKSCGPNACGITSSVHHVGTNAMKLVAADTRILPLGSMISVPGYDKGSVVPVLDRGGAIKGNRLDVLYPTDAIARQWGVQKLEVTVWEYADNLPPDDYRAIRDSKN